MDQYEFATCPWGHDDVTQNSAPMPTLSKESNHWKMDGCSYKGKRNNIQAHDRYIDSLPNQLEMI
jgi:hypothetical protein